MKTQNTPNIGIAALSFTVNAGGVIQLTPDGTFKARDGRPEGLPGFVMSADIAAALIARLQSRQNDIVVDYEHQTLYAEENGKPAPASGWIDPRSITFEPGEGLKAQVKWTATAAEHISKDEYRFLSPVLAYDKASGAVRDILHVALTNFPAVDGMAKVAIEALRARYSDAPDDQPHDQTANHNTPNDQEEDALVKREELIALLGLAAEATDEQITAALKAAIAAGDQLAALRAELGVTDGDGKEAIAALKAGAKPDLSKYAPVEMVEALKGEIAQLRNAQAGSEVDGLVKQALTDGKLLPAQEDWATELGNSNIAALKSYLNTTPAIAALKGNQTNGKKPEGADDQTHASGLSAEELEAAKLTGKTPAEYAALKAKLTTA